MMASYWVLETETHLGQWRSYGTKYTTEKEAAEAMRLSKNTFPTAKYRIKERLA